MPALTDFPDRLPPMLVKELRQGLRTRTFVALFLALQALLAVILLAAAGARTYDDAGPTLSRVIFLLFALAVLVIQPLRGMTAVSSEVRGHTLDLIVLTRLSAWRIVLGKWVALVGQSALLLAAIAPYLILRYFFGRMDLFAELLLLGGIFLASMFLTAVTVGLSGSPSLVVRGLLPVLGAPLLVVAILVVCLSPGLGEFIDFFSLGDPEARVVLAIGIGLACHVAWSALDFAAPVPTAAAARRSCQTPARPRLRRRRDRPAGREPRHPAPPRRPRPRPRRRGLRARRPRRAGGVDAAAAGRLPDPRDRDLADRAPDPSAGGLRPLRPPRRRRPRARPAALSGLADRRAVRGAAGRPAGRVRVARRR